MSTNYRPLPKKPKRSPTQDSEPFTHASRRWVAPILFVLAVWGVLYAVMGTAVGGAVALVGLALIVVAFATMIRQYAPHVWAKRHARPWRRASGCLRAAVRQLPGLAFSLSVDKRRQVAVPDRVTVWLSPREFVEITEMMGLSEAERFLTSSYHDFIRASRAKATGHERVRIRLDENMYAGDVVVQRGEGTASGRPEQIPGYTSEGYEFLDDDGRLLDDRADVTGTESVDPGPFPVPAEPHAVFFDPLSDPSYDAGIYLGPQIDPPLSGMRTVPFGDGTCAKKAGSGTAVLNGNPARAASTFLGDPPSVVTARSQKPRVPRLALHTDDEVVEVAAGVRLAVAGRGEDVDLVLPVNKKTSRRHGEFKYEAGQWWLKNISVGGTLLIGRTKVGRSFMSVSDGDQITWGSSPDSSVSLVRIDKVPRF